MTEICTSHGNSEDNTHRSSRRENASRRDLENELQDQDEIFLAQSNQLEYLQCALLIVLMNPNLYELLQTILLHEINQCSKNCKGETILKKLRGSEHWMSLMGPELVDDETLDTFLQSVYTKMENYRKYGNLNL